MNNFDKLVKEAALNREAFRDFPKKNYRYKEATNDGCYLTYVTIFRDNTWQKTLWSVAEYTPDSQKKRKRRIWVADKTGRVLNLHQWALLKNLDYASLRHYYLSEGLSLDQAMMLAKPGYKSEDFPFYPVNAPKEVK